MADPIAPPGFKEVAAPPGFREVVPARPVPSRAEKTRYHLALLGDPAGMATRRTLETEYGRRELWRTGSPVYDASMDFTVDYVLPILAITPLIYAGGAVAGAVGAATGVPWLSAVAPAAGRVAVTGGVGAAREVSEGRPAFTPRVAVETAAAALPEIGSAAARMILGRMAAPAARAATATAQNIERESLATAERSAIAARGTQVFPELEAGAEELFGMAKEWGQAQMRRVVQPAVNEVSDRLRDAYGTPFLYTVPALSKTPVSFAWAWEQIERLPAHAAREARQQLLGTIEDTGDLVTARILRSAWEARNATRTYLSALSKGFDRNGVPDPEKLRAYVNANTEKLERYSGRYWPLIKEALTGVGTAGPVRATFLPPAARVAEVPFRARAASAAATRMPGDTAQAAIDALMGTPPFSEIAVGATGDVVRHVPGLRRLVPHAASGRE